LMIIGSVARDEAGEESDVDCYLVVTDAEYHRREIAGALSFAANDMATYPGGLAGGKVINLAYIHAVADRGPEPARYAFSEAIVAFSRIPDLERVIATIPRYPESERTGMMLSFVSQLPVHMSYIELAEYSDNPYLLSETAVELVLFGGRLILAHNRVLYPGRKWFLRALAWATEKPPDLLDLAEELLRRPGIEPARRFCTSVSSFRDWPQPTEGHMARFQQDREDLWIAAAPLADR